MTSTVTEPIARDSARVRSVMWAGGIDSLGLALGWTVFNLLVVYQNGLGAVGEINAAMYLGVALSVPATGWLTTRLDGRAVLQLTGMAEVALRIASLGLLVGRFPLALIALSVTVTNIAAWTGYAAMRSEIAAATEDTGALTRYSAVIVTAEAIGACGAALLPISNRGHLAGIMLVAVALAYGGSLLPTFRVALQSRVGRRLPRSRTAPLDRQRRRYLALGAIIMVLCSGPTLLFVGVAATLHGRVSVAPAAAFFALGSLVAPRMERAIKRLNLPLTLTWSAWGFGMMVGWALAPWSVAGLLTAQLLSGLCLTGFQGTMDQTLAADCADGEATLALAQGSAARAAGSAAAVQIVPFFGTRMGLSQAAVIAPTVTLVGAFIMSLGQARGGGAPVEESRSNGPRPS